MQAAIAKRAFAGHSSPAYDCRRRRIAAEAWKKTRQREESGMEKLLNSLTGTIIAGFVLTVVEVLVIHAIH
jgi:hypothetical protein